MKNYRITVNGVEYEVSVEELGSGTSTAAQAVAPAQAAPAPAPSRGAAGKIRITAPMPGKILTVKYKEGDSVKKGDSVIVLEAMKMENEIYANEDGIVASVEVSPGDMVEGGDVLITLN